MAVLFMPPTVSGRPYALRRDRPYSSLFRFYGGIPTGINVFLLAGDVVTTAEPADPADVVRTFHGGHIHTVDETEAAALTAAGYADNLSVVEDEATPTGFAGFDDGEWGPNLPVLEGLTDVTYNRLLAYSAGEVVSHGGRMWQATDWVPRGVAPTGVGDGSVADRQTLLAERTGYALTANVTGGNAGPTYVVTSTAGTNVAGTLRYGIEGLGLASPSSPRWIVFDPSLDGQRIDIAATQDFQANKTVDGRAVPNLVVNFARGARLRGIDVPGGATTIRYPGGVANLIFTHLTLPFEMTSNNQSGFVTSSGADGIWWNHCSLSGTTDSVISIVDVSAGGAGNVWAGAQMPLRATLSWCKIGPHPTAFNLAAYPTTGADNRPENGKALHVGLDPEDATWPNAIQVTLDRCWLDGTVQRNPKLSHGRLHMLNSHVSRWGLAPGVVRDATDQALYVAAGFPTPIDASHGTIGSEVQHGGKLLAHGSIWTPYTPGEAHVLSPAWPMLSPSSEAVADTSGEAISVNGAWLRGTATKAADKGTIFTPPYTYTALAADADLLADLNPGAGNVALWELVP